jgi:hypothetical protein
MSDASNTVHSTAGCVLRWLAPQVPPCVAEDWGRRSTFTTPSINHDHAKIIRKLLTVGVAKETEMR